MVQPTEDNSTTPPSRGPSFTFTALLVITMVASVMAAAGYYLARGIESGRQQQFAFILFTLAAPVLLIVLISTLVRLLDWVKRRDR